MKKNEEILVTMLPIDRDDFKELMPTKFSIARLFAHLISKYPRGKTTYEQLYEEIEESHIRLFGQNPPFSSFDSFRKYFTKHQKDIYR